MKLIFTPLAGKDVNEIIFYIINDLDNKLAALNLRNSIEKRSNMLQDFPMLGASLENVDVRLSNYRYITVKNYILIYKINTESVIVIRVLYALSHYIDLLTSK